MYTYNAKILNVVDGDTFDLDIDLGFHIHNHVRARLLNINTPEKFGAERIMGEICKEYAKQNFEGKNVIISSEKDDKYTKTDSFGRWLVTIKLSDGSTIEQDYNALGINKYQPNYSEENVKALGRLIKYELYTSN